MKKLTTMRKALRDPSLLGAALQGKSWHAWRVLLIATVGERLTAAERKIFKKLTGRSREPGVMVETLLVVAGRRSGKTKAMGVLSTYLAMCCDWSEDLSIGERGLALYLAPSERQAGVAHDYAAGVIDSVELLRSQVAGRTSSSIQLHNGLCMETQAASWRFSRGSTAICITFDECAFLRSSEDSANSDVELMTALKPSLATTGGPMLLTSSPAQMEGIVYKLHKRHFGPKGAKHVLVAQADSRTLNPALRKAVVDRAYADDATGADAEYGGRFRSPVSNYLERSVVEKAVETGVAARLPIPLVQYSAFCDVAGGSGKDSYCICVGHNQHHQGRDVCVVDALLEITPPFDPDDATRRCAELLKQWSCFTVLGDAYASQWPVTAFAKHGITYQTAALNRSEIYLHALPAWTAGRVVMLDHAKAVDQLCGLKRKLLQGGKELIDHVRGAHDDLANVISGVLWRLTPVQPPFVLVDPLIFSSPVLCPGDIGYGGSTRNPALGLPQDGRDSWSRGPS